MRTTFVSAMAVLCAMTGWSGDGSIRRAHRPRPNSYIVVLNDNIIDEVEVIADDLIKKHGGKAVHRYKHAIKGFSVETTSSMAARISHDPRVKFVEEDAEISLAGTITPRSWNVDRIENRLNPRLDNTYIYCSTGRGVRAYIVDTGVWSGHDEFSNPDPITGGPRVPVGWDYLNAKNSSWPNLSNNPCSLPGEQREAENWNGAHGTAVASVLGGRTLGAAPEVTLVPVRFMDCGGRGFTSDMIAGLNWIPTDPSHLAGHGRVVNLSHEAIDGSIGGDGTITDGSAIENTIRGLLAQGITVVGGRRKSERADRQQVHSRTDE